MLVSASLLLVLCGPPAPAEPAPEEASTDTPAETESQGDEPAPEPSTDADQPATSAAGPAYAEELETLPPEQQDRDKAFPLFQSGSAAYGEARYAEAIEFFAQAYREMPRDNLLYSLGQAHKRLYEAEFDPVQRRYAILRYSQYLRIAPTGEFAVEASRYMTSMMAQADLAAPTDRAPVTRVMVSTAADNAWMRVDDGEKVAAPGVAAVEPGRRRVMIGADGHATQTKFVRVTEGALEVLNVELAQLPGEVVVTGPRGAEVAIDGRTVGTLPLGRPIIVEPGVRFVAVTRNGHVAYTRQLEVGPDESVSVKAQMRSSTQRILSYSMLGLGGAGLIASGVTLGLAMDAQSTAQDLENSVGIGTDDYQRYLDQVDRRNAMRATSIATGAVGAGLLVTGIVLFVLDRPQVEVPLYDRNRESASGPRPTLSLRPQTNGGGLRLRF